jgi:hypothetical protein
MVFSAQCANVNVPEPVTRATLPVRRYEGTAAEPVADPLATIVEFAWDIYEGRYVCGRRKSRSRIFEDSVQMCRERKRYIRLERVLYDL